MGIKIQKDYAFTISDVPALTKHFRSDNSQMLWAVSIHDTSYADGIGYSLQMSPEIAVELAHKILKEVGDGRIE